MRKIVIAQMVALDGYKPIRKTVGQRYHMLSRLRFNTLFVCATMRTIRNISSAELESMATRGTMPQYWPMNSMNTTTYSVNG